MAGGGRGASQRERRPPQYLQDEGYVAPDAAKRKKHASRRRIVRSDDEDDDHGVSPSPPPSRKRLKKVRPREDDIQDLGSDEESRGSDSESSEGSRNGSGDDEGEDSGSGNRGGRRRQDASADELPSLEEIMAEAKEKGQQREDAGLSDRNGRKSGSKKSKKKGKNGAREGTSSRHVNTSSKGQAPGGVTANSQVFQLQEKIRLQKELLAVQGSQLPSTALVPFGYPQSVVPGMSQSLAAFQAPSAGMDNLLPTIQAMVAQAMQGVSQGGPPSVVTSGPSNTAGRLNKCITQKTMKTIGKAIHHVFESGSSEGGFYTSIDPIAKVTRVKLKIPRHDNDWQVGWVANHGELWAEASKKHLQQRSEVVKKVKCHLFAVYEIRKPNVDYNGFLADVAPLQGDGFRVRQGDPLGDIRLKRVIGHVFLRNWNERVDELRVFIQQAAMVVAVIDMVIGNPAENRAPYPRLPNDGQMALHYDACLNKIQAEIDAFAPGGEYDFIRAPEPSLFMMGEDEELDVTPSPCQNSSGLSGNWPPLAAQPVNVNQPVSSTGTSANCQSLGLDPQILARAIAMAMARTSNNGQAH